MKWRVIYVVKPQQVHLLVLANVAFAEEIIADIMAKMVNVIFVGKNSAK